LFDFFRDIQKYRCVTPDITQPRAALHPWRRWQTDTPSTTAIPGVSKARQQGDENNRRAHTVRHHDIQERCPRLSDFLDFGKALF